MKPIEYTTVNPAYKEGLIMWRIMTVIIILLTIGGFYVD